jgi:KilA-N domain
MVQLDLPVIPRSMDGKLIQQRASDGFINATAMCNAANKKISHYLENKTTIEFVAELAADAGIPASQLIQVVKGGNPDYQGTWVHPDVAIHLPQWLSPKFAVQVSKWVREWITGTPPSAGLSAHIKRYLHNRSEIPHAHVSMLNEITFGFNRPT